MPALDSLLAYYEPLSMLRRDLRGTATLHTPGSPLLGANATYLPLGTPAEVWPLLRAWHAAHQAPPLMASVGALPGHAPEERWRVGRYHRQPDPGIMVVEQTSRLHMSTVAALLCEAYGLPGWAAALGRGLAASLERLPAASLLLAYAGGEPVGALLWQPGAAHLWGTLDPSADAALLNAAAELQGPGPEGPGLWTSLPDTSPLTVTDEEEVCFTLL